MAAKRTPKDPAKTYPITVRGLTGAQLDALDALVDARNASLGPGARTSRELVATELLVDGIARATKGGA